MVSTVVTKSFVGEPVLFHFYYFLQKFKLHANSVDPDQMLCSVAPDLDLHHLHRYLSRRVTKPTKWPVHPAKTQISLGIHPV